MKAYCGSGGIVPHILDSHMKFEFQTTELGLQECDNFWTRSEEKIKLEYGLGTDSIFLITVSYR
jgi:hypothetical protein